MGFRKTHRRTKKRGGASAASTNPACCAKLEKKILELEKKITTKGTTIQSGESRGETAADIQMRLAEDGLLGGGKRRKTRRRRNKKKKAKKSHRRRR